MKLRELSREFTMTAVTDQSDDNINLALVTYCLNKVFSKIHFKENLVELKVRVLAELEAGDYIGALDELESFDNTFGAFEGNLVKKGRIKIGSRLYSNGLSLSQSASLVDISVSDILSYVGATKTHEKIQPRSVSERFAVAKEVIGK